MDIDKILQEAQKASSVYMKEKIKEIKRILASFVYIVEDEDILDRDGLQDLVRREIQPLIDDIYDNLYNNIRNQVKGMIDDLNEELGRTDVDIDEFMLLLMTSKFKGKTLEQRFNHNKNKMLKDLLTPFRKENIDTKSFKYFDNSLKTATWRHNILEESELVRSLNNLIVFFAINNSYDGFYIEATIDERTTDYCVSVNGKFIPAEELTQEMIPPYHVNCRTILVPKNKKIIFKK